MILRQCNFQGNKFLQVGKNKIPVLIQSTGEDLTVKLDFVKKDLLFLIIIYKNVADLFPLNFSTHVKLTRMRHKNKNLSNVLKRYPIHAFHRDYVSPEIRLKLVEHF